MIVHQGKISLILCDYCGEVIVTVADLLPITKEKDICADCAISRQMSEEETERIY